MSLLEPIGVPLDPGALAEIVLDEWMGDSLAARPLQETEITQWLESLPQTTIHLNGVFDSGSAPPIIGGLRVTHDAETDTVEWTMDFRAWVAQEVMRGGTVKTNIPGIRRFLRRFMRRVRRYKRHLARQRRWYGA